MHFMFDSSCPSRFVSEATQYLMHPRGWTSKGYKIKPVATRPDVVIYFRSAEEMQKKYGKYKYLKGLSVTDSRFYPTIIDIHAGNWNNPPHKFKGTTKEYRAYLINHEMGHALGYGHTKLGKGKCQLMAQQSKGTKGCVPNGFPND